MHRTDVEELLDWLRHNTAQCRALGGIEQNIPDQTRSYYLTTARTYEQVENFVCNLVKTGQWSQREAQRPEDV